MSAERHEQPGKEAAGSRHEPSVVRQAETAAAECIGPPGEALMEEVLRRENLAMGTPESPRSTSDSAAALLNRRVRSRTHGGVGGRRG